MCKSIACLLLALTIGGGGTMALQGCAKLNSGQGISPEQAQAGVEYLESSVTTLQTALDAAKTTGDPSKVATVQAVLDKAKTATEAFKASSTGKDWDFAWSLITTAVSVAAPIAIQALVSGS